MTFDQRLIVEPGAKKLVGMYDWEDSVYDLPFFEPGRMNDGKEQPHFEVTLRDQRALIVKCLLPEEECDCPKREFDLFPYCTEEEGPLKVITGKRLQKAVAISMRQLTHITFGKP